MKLLIPAIKKDFCKKTINKDLTHTPLSLSLSLKLLNSKMNQRCSQRLEYINKTTFEDYQKENK